MDVQEKKPKNYFLIISAVIITILGIIIVLPIGNTDDDCFLGYRAFCPYTPLSTIIMFLIAAFMFYYAFKSVNYKTK